MQDNKEAELNLRDKSTDILKTEFRINEIFCSLQGEGTRAGRPCVFIRLQGCKLRCSWCDTKFSQRFDDKADLMTGEQILEEVKKHECCFVALTGGEPMDHDNVLPLLNLLCDNFETVELETNGSVDLSEVDKRVVRIMDMKAPSSSMTEFNHYENFELLTYLDEVKFVVANTEDYIWAKDVIEHYQLQSSPAEIIFSPVFGRMDPAELAARILADKLNARMQLQLHKYIWDPDARSV